jgi:YD repeat-containing protein
LCLIATCRFFTAEGKRLTVSLPKLDDAKTAETTELHPTYTYGYDAAGNQWTDVDPYGRVTAFGYDAQGRRTSRTLPGGEVELWRYDDRGRAEWHRDFNGVWEQSIFYDAGVVVLVGAGCCPCPSRSPL